MLLVQNRSTQISKWPKTGRTASKQNFPYLPGGTRKKSSLESKKRKTSPSSSSIWLPSKDIKMTDSRYNKSWLNYQNLLANSFGVTIQNLFPSLNTKNIFLRPSCKKATSKQLAGFSKNNQKKISKKTSLPKWIKNPKTFGIYILANYTHRNPSTKHKICFRHSKPKLCRHR